MVKILRKFAVAIVLSNPFTRAVLFRMALDETALAKLLASQTLRHRIRTDAGVRNQFECLLTDVGMGVPSDHDSFYEPGLVTLRSILADARAMNLIYSERPLLRKFLRTPFLSGTHAVERATLVDEIAQFGPLLRSVLLGPRGQAALWRYFGRHKERPAILADARNFMSALCQSGVLEDMVREDDQLAEVFRNLLPEPSRSSAARKEE